MTGKLNFQKMLKITSAFIVYRSQEMKNKILFYVHSERFKHNFKGGNVNWAISNAFATEKQNSFKKYISDK